MGGGIGIEGGEWVEKNEGEKGSWGRVEVSLPSREMRGREMRIQSQVSVVWYSVFVEGSVNIVGLRSVS